MDPHIPKHCRPPAGTGLAWEGVCVSEAEDGLHRTTTSTTRQFPRQGPGLGGKRIWFRTQRRAVRLHKNQTGIFLKKGKVCGRWEDPRQTLPSRSLTLPLLRKEICFFLGPCGVWGPSRQARKETRRPAGTRPPPLPPTDAARLSSSPASFALAAFPH